MRVSRIVSLLDERRVLRSARMMQCKDLLDAEVSQTVEKYRLICYKIDELLQFEFICACFDAGREACTTLCTHDAVKMCLNIEVSQTGEKYRLIF